MQSCHVIFVHDPCQYEWGRVYGHGSGEFQVATVSVVSESDGVQYGGSYYWYVVFVSFLIICVRMNGGWAWQGGGVVRCAVPLEFFWVLVESNDIQISMKDPGSNDNITARLCYDGLGDDVTGQWLTHNIIIRERVRYIYFKEGRAVIWKWWWGGFIISEPNINWTTDYEQEQLIPWAVNMTMVRGGALFWKQKSTVVYDINNES